MMAFASDVTAAEAEAMAEAMAEAINGGYGVVTLVVVGELELAMSGRTQQR